ncbi:MAG TPA: 30S ribosome-binding factor RbfA [Patescibacteria group bacterium]|nr:30S ribosome-binding factor RbfA [Patescibacteria group bacterium]
MNDRMAKINELIAQELGMIIRQEIEFPADTLVTIMSVKTASDLRQAKVYISVLPLDQTKEVMKLLIKDAYNLQHVLNDKITLKFIPKLMFYIDKTAEQVKDIDDLLNNLKY